MFGEERGDMLELWDVGHTSGDLPFRTDHRKRTAILWSSTELMCLNASIAAAYPRIIKERTICRCDGVLTIEEGSGNEATLLN